MFMDRKYHIPPYWARLVFEVVAILVSIAAIIYAFVSKELVLIPTALLIGGICAYFIRVDARSWELDANGITCLRFGRPYKTVPWQQVIQVGSAIIGGRFSGGSSTFIIVTLDGAEKFDPKKDVGGEYMSKWDDHVISIYFNDKAVSAFEALYGKLDYVSRKN